MMPIFACLKVWYQMISDAGKQAMHRYWPDMWLGVAFMH